MQKSIALRWNRWLLPAVLILFILQLVMLPWALSFTWADRSDSPAQVLTYSANRLTWDAGTNIRPDGTAEMKLFFDSYDDTVKSGNGDKVAAPGTGEEMFVRLFNTYHRPVKYTAVLYQIKSDDRIPVEAVMLGTGFNDTAVYTLPAGVWPDQVIRAVTGYVKPSQLQDFDLRWRWTFEESDAQNALDTLLGNQDPLGEVTVGLYIVVEDENGEIVDPENPKTGDDSHVGLYLGLMVVSFFLLLFLLWERRREKKNENT